MCGEGNTLWQQAGGEQKLKCLNKAAAQTIVCLPLQLAPEYACDDTPSKIPKFLFVEKTSKKTHFDLDLLPK